MSYCPECGFEVDRDDRYCPDCGHDLSSGGRDSGQSDVDRSVETPDAVTDPSPGDADENGDGPSPSTGRFTTGQKILLAGTGLAVLGAFLPWITANLLGTNVSVRGIDRDGLFTLILALLAGGVCLFRWGRIARASVFLLGILITAIGILYIGDPLFGVDISTSTNPELLRAAVNPGFGLYLTAIGGVGILGGPLVDYLR